MMTSGVGRARLGVKGGIGKLGLADRIGGPAELPGVGAIVDDELDGRGGVLEDERPGAFDAFALGDLIDKWANGGLVGKEVSASCFDCRRGSSWGRSGLFD